MRLTKMMGYCLSLSSPLKKWRDYSIKPLMVWQELACFLKDMGVDHLHSKLAPMHKTGEGSGFKPIEFKLDKFFERYEGYLSSHDHSRANDKELSTLAALIRSYDSHP